MGAAASANLTTKEEFELFDKLKKNYEENKGADDKEVFEVMRQTVADYTRGPNGVPRAEAKPSRNAGPQPTSVTELVPGDVVEAREKGTKLYFEAIVIERTAGKRNTHMDLQFSDGEVESCSIEDIRKVNSWNCCEVGDRVKVKEIGSRMEFEATIVCMDSDGNYTVSYGQHAEDYSGGQGEDDDEIEKGVSIDRIRKIESHRTRAQERWNTARNVVLLAMTSFSAGAHKKK